MRRRTGCGIFRWNGITIHAALGAGVGGNNAVDEARPTRARIEISPHLLTNAFHGLHLRLPRIADWGTRMWRNRRAELSRPSQCESLCAARMHATAFSTLHAATYSIQRTRRTEHIIQHNN